MATLGEDFAKARGGRFLTDVEMSGLGLVNSQTGKTLSGGTPFAAPAGFRLFMGTEGIPLDRPTLLPENDPLVNVTSGGNFVSGLKTALSEFASGPGPVVAAALGVGALAPAAAGAGAIEAGAVEAGAASAGAESLPALSGPGAAEGTGLAQVPGLPSVDVAGPVGAGSITTALPGATGGAKTVLDTLKNVASIAGPAISLAGAIGGASAVNDAAKKLGAATAPQALQAGGSVLGTPAPVVFPPAVMPVMGSSQRALQVQKKSLTEQLQRRGRASTVLTSPAGDRLGS